jgi:hypothetical protein
MTKQFRGTTNLDDRDSTPDWEPYLQPVAPEDFSLVGEGLNVGKDPVEPITDDYPGTSPYAFTGGTIKEAIVDVSGEHYVDLELEALAMMKRE